jgi:carbonic anhydrase
VIPANEALDRLRAGNNRFVSDERISDALSGQAHLRKLASGQAPHAIILGCSDSRVPAEIIFDQGLGDLFVIRVAGNIVAPSQVGSVEFAAERTGARLVVVLGHSQCEAVTATLEALEQPEENRSPNLRAIVDRVKPAVKPLLMSGEYGDTKTILKKAVRANIRASVDHLRHGSEILERQIHEAGLLVVGAEYSLQTGLVEFFDGVPG